MISCSTSSNNCLLIVSPQNYYTVSMASVSTVEPLFNEPLFNEVLDVTMNDILHPGQIYSKMYGIEPWYNEPRFNEFFDTMNIIRKPRCKIYRYNELQCQHTEYSTRYSRQTLNRSTVRKSFNSYGKDQETATFQSTAYYMS